MSREEIVNNIGYQLTRAAVDYVEKHEFADGIDAFEAGAEWMQKKMIDKACEWLWDEIYERMEDKYIKEALMDDNYRANLVDAFRKAMED